MLALETRLTIVNFARLIATNPDYFMRYLEMGPKQILETDIAGAIRQVGAPDEIDKDTMENMDEASKLLQDVMILIHPNNPRLSKTPISPDSSSVGMGTGNPKPVV